MILLLWSAWAWASPMFSAMEPHHAEVATGAWRAATRCTGWEAPATDVVSITVDFLDGDYSGGAWFDGDRIERIAASPGEPERSIVHEVAHAWARSGPAALTEGRTDLLADCIVRLDPSLAPLDPDTGRDLDHLPDLRRWGGTRDHGLGDDRIERDAYLGAARLMRVLVTLVDPKVLWPVGGNLGWRDVEELLTGAGPAGDLVLDAIQGGADRQREALSDRDHDGQPWLAELLAGTDPNRWDSDGDGRWDGASERPSLAAVALPADGTPVCAGLSGFGPESALQVVLQSDLRGEAAVVSLSAGTKRLSDDAHAGIALPPRRPVLLRLDGGLGSRTGGVWALIGGHDVELDRRCLSTPRWTVWTEDPQSIAFLPAFAASLEEHLYRADALLGRGTRRAVVQLGARDAGIDPDGSVRISTGEVAWALANGRPDVIAGVAVAVHRVSGRDLPRKWDATEGLARRLMDDPPDLSFVSVDLLAADQWANCAVDAACDGP